MVIASEQVFAPHDDTTRFIALRFEFDHLINSFRANPDLERIKLIFPKVDDYHGMAGSIGPDFNDTGLSVKSL